MNHFSNMNMNQKRMAPGRFIAIGFAAVIFLGALLLMLPISVNKGIDLSVIDAFFTSTSAVCVTGLISVDSADTFTVFGRIILACLIQIGGLGVTSIGVGFIILAGKKVGMRERLLVKESINLQTFKGIVSIVQAVLLSTLFFELVGMILSFFVFVQDYSIPAAIGISAFHSVAAFNNSGFDILGGLRSLVPYQSDVLLNLTTCALIIFGGLGFFVTHEIVQKRSFRKFSLHTKVVLFMTATLLIVGALLIKATENITWLGAFFTSTSARTAGFATFPLGNFTNAGLFVVIILMFIGASPGSTGGGIKTTTFFVLIHAAIAASTNKNCSGFRRTIPKDIITKAFIITGLAASVVFLNTYLLCILEPNYNFIQLLFEIVSGFGTVGLSTGITPDLHVFSKIILIITMFIGRLGPLTIASLWVFRPTTGVSFAEESITIG